MHITSWKWLLLIFFACSCAETMVNNKKITGQSNRTICYSFESYAQELFDLYENGEFPQNIRKDLEKGDIIKVTKIRGVKDNTLIVELECGINVDIALNKEKKFTERFGYTSV